MCGVSPRNAARRRALAPASMCAAARHLRKQLEADFISYTSSANKVSEFSLRSFTSTLNFVVQVHRVCARRCLQVPSVHNEILHANIEGQG